MTQFAEGLAYAQVTEDEMCLIDINFIYLPSKVTINYPVSGNDIQQGLSRAHSCFITSLSREQVEPTNIFMPLVEYPTIAQFSTGIIFCTVCCIFVSLGFSAFPFLDLDFCLSSSD